MLHLIADNYATHKHPVVQDWLAKHPHFHMHFTLTSASWLNMVERFFRDITTERLRRAVFTSVPELIGAIDEYIAHHNTQPKPFIWTKSSRDILQKVIRANTMNDALKCAYKYPLTQGFHGSALTSPRFFVFQGTACNVDGSAESVTNAHCSAIADQLSRTVERQQPCGMLPLAIENRGGADRRVRPSNLTVRRFLQFI